MTVLSYRPEPKSKHRHKPVRSHRTTYLGPVTHKAPWEAQGGIARIETCECGATRRVNVNGVHIEDGAWQISGYVQQALSGVCLSREQQSERAVLEQLVAKGSGLRR
jgi:hypothetical protein